MIGSSNRHACTNKSCDKTNMTEEDAAALAHFTFIEGTFDTDEIQLVQSRSAGAPPEFTLYVESATTYGPTKGVPGFEQGIAGFEEGGFRESARFYLQGNLTADLSESDSALQLCASLKYRSRFPAPVPPSTTDGNVSAKPDPRHNISGGFVSFLRIGDELIKVITAENVTASDPEAPPCQRLVVQRGLDGSAVTQHKAGAPVLAPAYANVRAPTGPNNLPTYHPRYNSTYGVDFLLNWTLYALAQGYSGSWFDSWHPQPSVVS